MRQIYIAIANRDPKNLEATVADGMMEIDDDADVLKAIQSKYPDAISAEPHEEDSPVFIVREKEKKK